MNRAIAFAILVVSSLNVAIATTGTWEVMQEELLLPRARKNPDQFRQRYENGETDLRKRMVLFMVLATLGKEKRISEVAFRSLVETGLADLHDPIRSHAVHSIERVFDAARAEELLQRVTLDKSSSVRYQGAEALVRYPTLQSLAYVDALLDDPSLSVRVRAASTLNAWFRNAGFQAAKDALLSASESQDIRRSGCAMAQLVTNHDVAPDPALMNRYLDLILESDPPLSATDYIRYVISILDAAKDPTSRTVLMKAATNSHPGVVSEAKIALDHLD